ncbi:MAG: SRPBCC family protein [Nakamurella sp.]
MTESGSAIRSRHVSTVIRATTAQVYAFAADPDNLPRWAAGLAQSEVHRDGDLLRVDSPMGTVTVQFAQPNSLGVLDHTVTLPSGTSVVNPMRVVEHPDGAEIIFTVRQLELTDAEFDRDCGIVAADLERLANLLAG